MSTTPSSLTSSTTTVGETPPVAAVTQDSDDDDDEFSSNNNREQEEEENDDEDDDDDDDDDDEEEEEETRIEASSFSAFASAVVVDHDDGLSEYERRRAANIAKNHARLEALGLGSPIVPKTPRPKPRPKARAPKPRTKTPLRRSQRLRAVRVDYREAEDEGTRAAPKSKARRKGTTAQPKSEVRSSGTTAAPMIEARRPGLIAAPMIEARSSGTAALPRIEARSSELIAAPMINARSSGSTAAPMIEARRPGLIAAPMIEARSSRTAVLPRIEARSSELIAAPMINARSSGTTAAPRIEARSPGLIAAPMIEARSSGTTAARAQPSYAARGDDPALWTVGLGGVPANDRARYAANVRRAASRTRRSARAPSRKQRVASPRTRVPHRAVRDPETDENDQEKDATTTTTTITTMTTRNKRKNKKRATTETKTTTLSRPTKKRSRSSVSPSKNDDGPSSSLPSKNNDGPSSSLPSTTTTQTERKTKRRATTETKTTLSRPTKKQLRSPASLSKKDDGPSLSLPSTNDDELSSSLSSTTTTRNERNTKRRATTETKTTTSSRPSRKQLRSPASPNKNDDEPSALFPSTTNDDGPSSSLPLTNNDGLSSSLLSKNNYGPFSSLPLTNNYDDAPMNEERRENVSTKQRRSRSLWRLCRVTSKNPPLAPDVFARQVVDSLEAYIAQEEDGAVVDCNERNVLFEECLIWGVNWSCLRQLHNLSPDNEHDPLRSLVRILQRSFLPRYPDCLDAVVLAFYRISVDPRDDHFRRYLRRILLRVVRCRGRSRTFDTVDPLPRTLSLRALSLDHPCRDAAVRGLLGMASRVSRFSAMGHDTTREVVVAVARVVAHEYDERDDHASLLAAALEALATLTLTHAPERDEGAGRWAFVRAASERPDRPLARLGALLSCARARPGDEHAWRPLLRSLRVDPRDGNAWRAWAETIAECAAFDDPDACWRAAGPVLEGALRPGASVARALAATCVLRRRGPTVLRQRRKRYKDVVRRARARFTTTTTRDDDDLPDDVRESCRRRLVAAGIFADRYGRKWSPQDNDDDDDWPFPIHQSLRATCEDLSESGDPSLAALAEGLLTKREPTKQEKRYYERLRNSEETRRLERLRRAALRERARQILPDKRSRALIFPRDRDRRRTDVAAAPRDPRRAWGREDGDAHQRHQQETALARRDLLRQRDREVLRDHDHEVVVVARVVSFLSHRSLCRAARTCRLWSAVVRSSKAWETLYRRRWTNAVTPAHLLPTESQVLSEKWHLWYRLRHVAEKSLRKSLLRAPDTEEWDKRVCEYVGCSRIVVPGTTAHRRHREFHQNMFAMRIAAQQRQTVEEQEDKDGGDVEKTVLICGEVREEEQSG